jgi:thiamine-monophosphate kinase
LRELATSAIDLSDGLLGDLGHVLQRSGVGAQVFLDRLPRSAVLARQPAVVMNECLLAGGDDYELLFTAPVASHADVLQVGRQAGVGVTPVGHIVATPGLQVLGAAGQPIDLAPHRAFDHFRT